MSESDFALGLQDKLMGQVNLLLIGREFANDGASFTFTSGGQVDGAFININGSATVDNTTGTLFSAGDFGGGSKTVANTETLTVTYSLRI